MNTLYATKDNGRVHVAINEYYQDSVNSYNNFITRGITKLFGFSTDVTINGKSRCLNKKSYVKLLSTMGVAEASAQTLDNFKDFNAIQFKPVTDRGFMRSHLSAAKTDKLGRKLVEAMVLKNDAFLAGQVLGKGASVNQHFWIRGFNNSISYHSKLNYGLPHQKINPFQATNYTPFLYATITHKQGLAALLKKYGADTTQPGQVVTFSRELLASKIDTSFVPTYTPGYITHHPHHHHGHHHHHGTKYHPGHYGLDMVQKQTLTFLDTYANAQTLHYHEPSNTVQSIPNPHLTHTHQWSEDNTIGVTKLI